MKAVFFALLVIAMSLVGATARTDAELATASEPTAAAAESETLPAGEALPEARTGTIARSTFTTSVVGREPQDSITTLTNDHRKIYYFTELRDFDGATVTHRWEYNGEPVAEVYFDVGGPRWRVFSSKNLPEGATGEWAVSVVDDMNQVLRTETFSLTQSPEPSVASEAKSTPEPVAPAASEETGGPIPAALSD